jgi:chlorophyllide a reductase subunit X
VIQKSDTTSLLSGGKASPTIIETASKKKPSGEVVMIGDVCFKRGGAFAFKLGDTVADAPPMRPTALNEDRLLVLFDSKDIGGDYVLQPATEMDIRRKNVKPLKSLEVIYNEP